MTRGIIDDQPDFENYNIKYNQLMEMGYSFFQIKNAYEQVGNDVSVEEIIEYMMVLDANTSVTLLREEDREKVIYQKELTQDKIIDSSDEFDHYVYSKKQTKIDNKLIFSKPGIVVSVRGLYKEDSVVVRVQKLDESGESTVQLLNDQFFEELPVSNDHSAEFYDVVLGQNYFLTVENTGIYDPTKHHPKFTNYELNFTTFALSDLYECGISHSNGSKKKEIKFDEIDKIVKIELVCSKKLLQTMTSTYRTLHHHPFNFSANIVTLIIAYLEKKVTVIKSPIYSLGGILHSDWDHWVQSTTETATQIWNYSTRTCLDVTIPMTYSRWMTPLAYLSRNQQLLLATPCSKKTLTNMREHGVSVCNSDSKNNLWIRIMEPMITEMVFFPGTGGYSSGRQDYLLLNTHESTLEIWDIAAKRCVFNRSNSDEILSCMAVVVAQPTIIFYVYREEDDDLVFYITVWRPFSNHARTVEVLNPAVNFHLASDGQLLIGQSPALQTLWFWDLTPMMNGENPRERTLTMAKVNTQVMYISPNHQYFVVDSVRSGLDVDIYETTTLTMIRKIMHGQTITSITMLSGGKAIIIGDEKGNVIVYDVATTEELGHRMLQ